MDQVSIEPKSRRPVKLIASDDLLRHICGWSLVAAAFGVFIDEALCGSCSDGSWGLVPLYLGFLIGSLTLVPLLYKHFGWLPACIATLGLVAMWYFMGTYPNGANGWIGTILIGIACLFFPMSGRLIAVVWVISGTLGFPAFHARSWGIVRAYSVFGVATGYLGLFILFGLPRSQKDNVLSQQKEMA